MVGAESASWGENKDGAKSYGKYQGSDANVAAAPICADTGTVGDGSPIGTHQCAIDVVPITVQVGPGGTIRAVDMGIVGKAAEAIMVTVGVGG